MSIDALPVVYEHAVEKPPTFVAYRVRDYENNPAIGIVDESRRIATLPFIKSVAVESKGQAAPSLIATHQNGETVVLRPGRWLVLRHQDHGRHHLDQWALCSGLMMVYSDAEFRDRYECSLKSDTWQWART